jgi:hypothetical protein
MTLLGHIKERRDAEYKATTGKEREGPQTTARKSLIERIKARSRGR